MSEMEGDDVRRGNVVIFFLSRASDRICADSAHSHFTSHDQSINRRRPIYTRSILLHFKEAMPVLGRPCSVVSSSVLVRIDAHLSGRGSFL